MEARVSEVYSKMLQAYQLFRSDVLTDGQRMRRPLDKHQLNRDFSLAFVWIEHTTTS